MQKIVRAGFTYFAIVFGAGFALGVFRVPFLVPRIGERWAELAEMPVMAVVIFWSAGYILRRYPEINRVRRALLAGLLALGLLVGAELALAVILQEQSLVEYIEGRDSVSGSAYGVLLLVLALMPGLRLKDPRN